MQEVLEQVIDYLKGIWIKRRYIILATWLICPIGWYMVAQMPNVYKSEARIFVDTQSLLRPLLRGLTIETNPNAQISLMVKTLLSRPNLERISRMSDLDVMANNTQEYDRIINGLKSRIKVKRSGRENIYTISIEDKNAEMAKTIVQSTLTVFIENTLGETRGDSDNAQKFLDEQIKEYENRLLSSEARRTEFQQKYSEVLSNSTGGYYQNLNSSRSRLKEAKLVLQETQGRLDSALQQLESGSASARGNNQNNTNSLNITTKFDDRILQLEEQLDSLLLRYTSQHPDVKESQRLLEHLQEKQAQELEQYYASLADETSDNYASSPELDSNPVYQELKIQANQLTSEVASLTVRVESYQAQVDDLEERIHTVPEIEAEATALDRGYQITKQQYEQLLRRKESLSMGESANESTDKIQFKVIDPPRAPEKPSGPKRYMLFGVIIFVGVGVGIGLSLLMSQLNPIVTSAMQLSKATGLPVLGLVSANENLGLQKWHRKKTFIFMLSNVMLLVVLAIFVSYFLFPDLVQAPLKRIF